MLNNTPVSIRVINQAYNLGKLVDNSITTTHKPVADAIAQWLIDTPHGADTVLAVFPANTLIQILERLADVARTGKKPDLQED